MSCPFYFSPSFYPHSQLYIRILKFITKPIVQTCIESIIVVDKHNIVFVLPNNEKANYELIKERRAKLVEHTPVLEGNITYPRRFRPGHLHYKVVLM